MKIIYLGADVPSNRTLLESTVATNFGVSFWRVYKRGLPKTKPYLLEERFPEHAQIYVHGGLPKTENFDDEFLEDFFALYEDFIANNLDRITWFNELVHPDISPELIEAERLTCWAEVPPSKFQPVWSPSTGIDGLKELVATYLDIGIDGADIEGDSKLASICRSSVTESGTRFHALNTAKPDNLRQVPVVSASTLSWLAPMLHGETIVWDGSRLVRYNKKMKDQARTRYKNIYEKAGLDYDLIMQDDEKEVCKLAVWSYDQLEKRMTMAENDPLLASNSDDKYGEENTENLPDLVGDRGSEMRKLEGREPEDIALLPGFVSTSKEFKEKDTEGNEVTIVRQMMSSEASSMRACNSCFISAKCPAFKPGASCAYKIPVEIDTPEQLESLAKSLVEMQTQRVLFMRFAEDTSGGYADPNLSQELDRLSKLIKATAELTDTSSSFKLTVETKNQGPGIIGRIFGGGVQDQRAVESVPSKLLNANETDVIIAQVIGDPT